ncbi:hypothetical protein Tco_0764724 [Tanacetum coccineum]
MEPFKCSIKSVSDGPLRLEILKEERKKERMDHLKNIKQVSDQSAVFICKRDEHVYYGQSTVPDISGGRSTYKGPFLGPNATGSTINDVNSQTTSPNQNDGDQANLRKFEANVPHGADYKVWLPLASVQEVNDRTKNSLYGTPMMLDSYMNSMCLESLRRSIYARILVETNACNEFGDHMVMVVLNLEGNDYMKETIRIEYKIKVSATHQGADDEGYIEVKRKKSGGTSSPKMTPFVDTNKASTSGYNKEPPSNKGNTFSLRNSFDALNDENLIIKEVSTGSMTTTLDDAKPPKKVDYLANLGNDDEVEPVENEMASFLASKPMSVGYGPKSLLEEWMESNVDDDYDHMIMICMNVRDF